MNHLYPLTHRSPPVQGWSAFATTQYASMGEDVRSGSFASLRTIGLVNATKTFVPGEGGA